jgi:DNA-binding protein HU-beta
MSLDKQQLIQRIAARTQKDRATVEAIVDGTLEEIYESLKQGESVSLRNFGTFYIRPERNGYCFKFNPSQRLRKMLGWSSTHKGEI